MIVGFFCHVGAGCVGPNNDRAATPTIAGSAQQCDSIFAFRPEQARKIAEELLGGANQAEGQDPTQD